MIDDALIVWAAAQPGARVWRRPGAAAVACANFGRRDRLPIHGDPDAVAALLRDEVLPEVGAGYRPLGADDLVTAVAARLPGLAVQGRFSWMDLAVPVATGEIGVRWLADDELAEADALLDAEFPDTTARPGDPGVHRWAGLREGGELIAIGADAWSTPAVGFLAGVATRTSARGRGLARAVGAFIVNDLLTDHDVVALFADDWNIAALTTYRKMGFVSRPFASAAFS